MFHKILIANRGEIAVRIARTAQRLGIHTVAVYSEADQTALHVKIADEAVLIGPAAPTDSYLSFDKIIQAARVTGAEAVHPGYGFLSENADFAEALEQENITFIGPAAATIRSMGSKSAAKDLMMQAGIPTLPGYHGDDQALKTFKEAAKRIGYPVLLKAVAGGGGKGMRLVERAAMMEDALASVRREAKSSFGDDRCLLEKLLLHPRHVEVQIFGDGQGRVVHLFDRDCSVQRRYQKILEEAPAFNLPPATRSKLLQAGVAAGQAVNYRGAGTVEFLYDGADRVYFMEMNTRLQVEHPVSEAITGIDCVEWQLRIAAGEGLPLSQAQITENGHAFEARLYAEDPYNQFTPSTGQLTLLRLPRRARNDSGVEEGQHITSHYDPMISKIITQAPTREAALAKMTSALQATRVAGLRTNAQFLYALCSEPDFVRGHISTHFIEEHSASLFSCADFGIAPLIAAGLWHWQSSQASAKSSSPWASLTSWRMNQELATEILWVVHRQDVARLTLSVAGRQAQGVLEIEASARARKKNQRHGLETSFACSVITLNGAQVVFGYEDVQYSGFVAPNRRGVRVWFGADFTDIEFADMVSGESGPQKAARGSLTAPMSGVVTKLNGRVGDFVSADQTLLVMEAMKMEHAIKAPEEGIIKKFPYAVGQQVTEGALLVELETKQSKNP